MTLTNFKFKTESGVEYTLDGEIELYPVSGFAFTKITKINEVQRDSFVLRTLIKHGDILDHIKKINNVLC